ncbi:MAG: hypothetical protein U0W24_18550 [Bacteroidales bacterium]
MIKRLKNFLNLFKFCKHPDSKNISHIISNDEKIVRSIFTPINISKDQKTIKSNAFKPPADSDEVSVNRLNFTNCDFCKAISKRIEMPLSDRNYFGLALLYANEIKDCNADLEYTPKLDNIYHADIKIGFIVKKGEPLPSEFQQKVNNLTKKARLFKDENPKSNKWDGKEIQ